MDELLNDVVNVIIAVSVMKTILSVLLESFLLVIVFIVINVGLMMIFFEHSDIVVVEVDAVFVGVLERLLPGGVSAGAVVTQNRQAAVVRE